MKQYHLAQANIARGKGRLDEPVMAEFAAQLDYVNLLAERAPGFVWRYESPVGDESVLRVFSDPLIVFNMSVWESVEALYEYAFDSDHRGPMRDRRKWFDRLDRSHSVLWWVQAGVIPTVEDADRKLRLLDEAGPTAEAFTFASSFDATGRQVARPVAPPRSPPG